MTYPYPVPDLEDRFLPPENWSIGDFLNPETNHKIHYSTALIQAAKGSVICLTGLSEFSEKYIETARFFNENGYNFYIMDWAYQGRSSRLRGEPHKRYSDGYDSDISDVDYFINQIIKTNTNLYMLGHSMGGHLGLRYLATQDHAIKSASFSTPMLGIQSLKYFPCWLRFIISPFHKRYVPKGKDWHEAARTSDGKDIFSSDPIRDNLHNAWCIKNPDLQIGSPTFKWLYESIKSIGFLKKKSTLQAVKIPVLFSSADKEKLVDNDLILKAALIIENAKLLQLKNAKHEILMETDDIRDEFLQRTLEIFSQSN